MSIGIAIQQIAKYSSLMEALAPQIQAKEGELLLAVNDPNKAKVGEIQQVLTRLKTLMGLAKDFMEFWKEVIKGVMGILKSINELAQGAR